MSKQPADAVILVRFLLWGQLPGFSFTISKPGSLFPPRNSRLSAPLCAMGCPGLQWLPDCHKVMELPVYSDCGLQVEGISCFWSWGSLPDGLPCWSRLDSQPSSENRRLCIHLLYTFLKFFHFNTRLWCFESYTILGLGLACLHHHDQCVLPITVPISPLISKSYPAFSMAAVQIPQSKTDCGSSILQRCKIPLWHFHFTKMARARTPISHD